MIGINKDKLRHMKVTEWNDFTTKRGKLNPRKMQDVGEWHRLDALCNYINSEILLIDNGVFEIEVPLYVKYDAKTLEDLIIRRDTEAKRNPAGYPIFIQGCGWMSITEAQKILSGEKRIGECTETKK
jgi:hypothetical protein